MSDRLDLLHEMSEDAGTNNIMPGGCYKPLEAPEGCVKEAPMDWAEEREVVNKTFLHMLKGVTGDGSKKRQTGSKPPWWRDDSHEKAIFSHLNKWKHGELVDKDSGQHPLVHLAWRALAIAFQETYGQFDPKDQIF